MEATVANLLHAIARGRRKPNGTNLPKKLREFLENVALRVVAPLPRMNVSKDLGVGAAISMRMARGQRGDAGQGLHRQGVRVLLDLAYLGISLRLVHQV